MKKSLGIILIITSFILWGFILVVPFLSFSGTTKTVLVTILVIAGEITFWLGAIFAGKDIVKRFIQNIWQRMKKEEDQ
ncbi:transporter suffix domain-containing protein [Bacillus sp. NEB1478]|uniref:transporter suffix domain-containing protein n=1 Tax=Bacillus sp. NEB1478 TaxID=3073816 RepID=UPI0028730263|nr:transporter suffix domain-containing protein [Bacillus sp. NEB1478]WNB91261.1 transporter suffix domain-containing protein [Bacillus sp. NEB1478]